MDGKEREELEGWEEKKVEGNGKMGGCPSYSCCLDKIPAQKQLTGGRSLFQLTILVTVHHCRGPMEGTGGHSTPSRQQSNECVHAH